MLYGNRLVRCYLGASRPKRAWRKRYGGSRQPYADCGAPTGVAEGEPDRQQNEFTGFDPNDNLPLARLRPVGADAYPRPYPLFNTALNRVAGTELAYQDRKADAFVLTPDYCGCPRTGYARTPAQGADADNLTVGRAMTISGAAVDPNMGVAQSAPLTALM